MGYVNFCAAGELEPDENMGDAGISGEVVPDPPITEVGLDAGITSSVPSAYTNLTSPRAGATAARVGVRGPPITTDDGRGDAGNPTIEEGRDDVEKPTVEPGRLDGGE